MCLGIIAITLAAFKLFEDNKKTRVKKKSNFTRDEIIDRIRMDVSGDLEEAVSEERYEDAALLRDELKRLDSNQTKPKIRKNV